MDAPPFADLVTDLAGLRELYRQPSALVQNKKRETLDGVSTRFVESAPLVMLGTASPEGTVEVSPRGGPPGWIKVLDPGRLLIPDLNGNNLLDSMTNIVANPGVGLLLIHPGKDETLRINGNAWISTDSTLIALCAEPRADGSVPSAPKAVIGVQISSVFIHCAKAFRRGSVWQPDSWPLLDPVDAVDILQCQLSIDVPREQLFANFADNYATELALDTVQSSR